MTETLEEYVVLEIKNFNGIYEEKEDKVISLRKSEGTKNIKENINIYKTLEDISLRNQQNIKS